MGALHVLAGQTDAALRCYVDALRGLVRAHGLAQSACARDLGLALGGELLGITLSLSPRCSATRLAASDADAPALLIAGLAPAQANAAEDEITAEDLAAAEAEPAEPGEAIVVTGSRIARPTLESSVPLTSVDVSELTDTGDVSLGDALNDLPSLRSTFSQGNSTRFIGTAGLNVLDL
eukprot:gene20839-25545_t